MPTSRSSTMSSRPTPRAPARSLSSMIASSMVTGLPSTVVGTPFSKAMHTSSLLARRGHEMLGDQRTRQRGNEWVALEIQSVGAEGGQAVVVRELIAQVKDLRLDGTAVERPLPDRVEILAALADVGGHADDLGTGL